MARRRTPPAEKRIAVITIDGSRYESTLTAKSVLDWLGEFEHWRTTGERVGDGVWVEVDGGAAAVRFDRIVLVEEAGRG